MYWCFDQLSTVSRLKERIALRQVLVAHTTYRKKPEILSAWESWAKFFNTSSFPIIRLSNKLFKVQVTQGIQSPSFPKCQSPSHPKHKSPKAQVTQPTSHPKSKFHKLLLSKWPKILLALPWTRVFMALPWSKIIMAPQWPKIFMALPWPKIFMALPRPKIFMAL